MSSEVVTNPVNPTKRKQKVSRACDSCRVKKTRCSASDGHSDEPCSSCVELGIECTYVDAPPNKHVRRKAYIQHLEERIDKLQKALNTFNPGVDISKTLNPPEEHADETETRSISTIPISLLHGSVSNEPSQESSDRKWDGSVVLPNPSRLPMSTQFIGYHGSSGIASLIITIFKIWPNISWDVFKLRMEPVFEMWKPGPWESLLLNPLQIPPDLPPIDLINTLINHYFVGVNNYWPLLNRKFIERDVRACRHLSDKSFRTTLLLICAIAAQSSQDPRVFAAAGQIHSRGWHWFHQAYASRPSLIEPFTLDGIQFYALSAQFLLGSSLPRSSWTLVSFGIKVAQNLGIHRRYAYKQAWSAHDELWKRAFWVLVAMDRTISLIIGRPCTVQDEDFDLSFPAECDDEYWDPDDLDKPLKQPQAQPSIVAYFNAYLRLQQIVAVTLRTLYCINRSKTMLGFIGPEWEQKMVSELDSALNQWLDSGVSEHLQWDPNRASGLFFDQSLALYACYHSTRMLIHRPFINANSSAPSLSICASSARACINLVHGHGQIQEPAVMMLLQQPLFTSGAILLIHNWKTKPRAQSADGKDLKLVQQCVGSLVAFKQTWKMAGFLGDFLFQLSTISESPQTAKRQRRTSTSSEGVEPPDNRIKRQATTMSEPSEGFEGTPDIFEAFMPDALASSATPMASYPIDSSFWYPSAQPDTVSFDGHASSSTDHLGFGGGFSFSPPPLDEHFFGNDAWSQYTGDTPGNQGTFPFFRG